MIQFPKNEHVTLPSVDAGLGSMNVLRDPPKAVYTRYKPKVGDTTQISQWIDESDDRSCEVIKEFARGVNPMVSVSYGNYGTNGGQTRFVGSGSTSATTDALASRLGTGQAFLPYRIMRDGEFRPPVRTAEQLLPLSRLPRLNTSAQTNIGSTLTEADFSGMRCDTDLRAVRQNLLKVCSTPKRTFNIDQPQYPSIDVSKAISNNTKNGKDVSSNKSGITQYTLGSGHQTNHQVKRNRRYASVATNAYKNLQAAPLISQQGNQPIRTQDRVSGGYEVNRTGRTGNVIVNPANYTLQANRPTASMTVNSGAKMDLNGNIGSREYRNLPFKPSLGGFTNSGTMSNYERAIPNGVTLGNTTVMQAAHQAQYSR